MFVSYLFIGQLTPFPSGLCPQADYFTSHFVFSIPLHTSLPPTSHHLKVTIDGSLPDNSLFLVQCCLTFQIHHVYLFPLLALVFFYHNHVHHLHFFISHPFTPLLRQPTVSFCWDQPSLLLIKDSGFSHDRHTKPVHFVPQSRLFTLWSTAASEPVAINFSSSSASHGFSSPRQALSPFSLRSSHWRGGRMNIEAKDGEYMTRSLSEGAPKWPGWKSIRNKFAQFWPTAG